MSIEHVPILLNDTKNNIKPGGEYMYSIGEISKIVNISIDALRYYDEIGLLKPSYIEQDNRYRYYSEEQVNEILSIMELKQYGFNLETIKDLIRCDDQDRLLTSFHNRLQQLNHEQAEIENSKRSLHRRIIEIERKDDYCMTNQSILIVDDSDFMRMMLKDMLEKHNYTKIDEATNGHEGFDQYLTLRPDLVIMDIHMSEELDGLDALKKIKSFDNNAKILMLSAMSFLPVVLECLQNGAGHFVAKPFGVDTLFNALEMVLDGKYHYNPDTISKLLAYPDLQLKCQTNPVSQQIIDHLLHLCSNDNCLNSTQIIDFMNTL